MKILLIHQYYLMAGHAGGSRFNEMARFWAEAGHDVTVIAGNVDYTTGAKPERYRRRWLTQEQDGCVTVWRCSVSDKYNSGYTGRMWAFIVFVLSAISACCVVSRPDIVVASSPPLMVVLVGWFAARCRWRVPWVFEVRDLWPESAITTGVLRKGSQLARLLFCLERFAYRSADRINVLTPAFREDIVERGLANLGKITLITNGADLDSFYPGPRDNAVRREFEWKDRIVFLYAGAHGRANALRQIVDAAEQLRNNPNILIASVGDGPQRQDLEAEVRRRGLSNIMFCGPQPKSRMCDFVNAADAGIAVLQNNPTFRTVYPNKVFDYMACERPIVLGIDGVARKLVCEEARAGVFAEPENAGALAEAMRLLADQAQIRKDLGRNGREWVVANASRSALASKYLTVLNDVVRPDATSHSFPECPQTQVDK